MKNMFCIFIPSHGRPNNVKTWSFLDRLSSKYDRYIVCDNEDESLDEYFKNFGDSVLVFNKAAMEHRIDTMDSGGSRNCILFARNACYDLAEELGYEYFLVLDDDTTNLRFCNLDGKEKVKEIDPIIDKFVEFLENTNVKTIAFSQGGEGFRSKRGDDANFRWWKRKAMNSFFCATNRRIDFIGRLNEDVNAYCQYGKTGDVFLTMYNVMLDQTQSQANTGGMTDIYKSDGTFKKSFYTVMLCPSAVKAQYMVSNHPRIHHTIKFNNLAPMIISDKYKKQ